MATVNKGLVQPVLGSIGWGAPLNEDFGGIDGAFGSVTTLSVTGLTATPVVLTLAQYQNMTIKFTGVLTANVTYQLPAGVGGQWFIRKNTSGAFTVTIASLGGGTSKVIDTEFFDLVCDGVDCEGNFGVLPTGSIMFWSGSVATIPVGWVLCDGTNGTPNLLDRFVAGAGSTYAVGASGGVTSVTLTQAQRPAHDHNVIGTTSSNGLHNHGATYGTHTHSYGTPSGVGAAGSAGFSSNSTILAGTLTAFTGVTIVSAGTHTHQIITTSTPVGGGESHTNMPPYYALCYVMKV